MLKNDFD